MSWNIFFSKNYFIYSIDNYFQDVLNNIINDTNSKTDEFKREQQFLSGIARRNFKKKNTYFCDICSIFLTSEKYCGQVNIQVYIYIHMVINRISFIAS